MVNKALPIYKEWNQMNNKINRTSDHMLKDSESQAGKKSKSFFMCTLNHTIAQSAVIDQLSKQYYDPLHEV
jgi:hypothetical protein